MRAIGGYFGLEPLSQRPSEPPPHNGYLLNLGRTAMLQIIRGRGYRRVWLPEYICPSVCAYLDRFQVPWATYPVDRQLEPDIPSLEIGDALVYVNYFGMKSQTCRALEKASLPLILDLTQALFYRPLPETDCFNSIRKFAGVLDGGYLLGPLAELQQLERQPWDAHDCRHLLERLAGDVSSGYVAFRELDQEMDNWLPAKATTLTESMLPRIRWEETAARRKNNFIFYQSELGTFNESLLNAEENGIPLCYPFQASWINAEIKASLIEQEIFVPTYWPGAGKPTWTERTLFLPCDQRYEKTDLIRVVDAVKNLMPH